MVRSMTHTKCENDVLDEYPLAPVGVCCPTRLMPLSVLDLEVSISFYTDKNLLQTLSVSTCIKATGEERLFSNCFFLGCRAVLVMSEPSPHYGHTHTHTHTHRLPFVHY